MDYVKDVKKDRNINEKVFYFFLWVVTIIYEDEEGAIFISADKKGIYKIEFTGFR